MHIYMCIYICVYIYICAYMCLCVYLHINTQKHTRPIHAHRALRGREPAMGSHPARAHLSFPGGCAVGFVFLGGWWSYNHKMRGKTTHASKLNDP